MNNFANCIFHWDVNVMLDNKFKKKHLGYPLLNYYQIIIICLYTHCIISIWVFPLQKDSFNI